MAITAGRNTYKPIDLREYGHNACRSFTAHDVNNSTRVGIAATWAGRGVSTFLDKLCALECSSHQGIQLHVGCLAGSHKLYNMPNRRCLNVAGTALMAPL